MARFNIDDSNNYTEVSFSDGLRYIEEHPGEKLYSNGLETDEYIHFVENHYEYEDGCWLGKDEDDVINRIGGLTSWVYKSKFYIKNECFNPNNDPYPLCKGNGKERCHDCCLYEDYERYHSPY